jgi:ribosomal protein S18 acetylase RimI-like enzyme
MLPREYPALRQFTYLAIHQPAGQEQLPVDVVDRVPELRACHADFGDHGDHCLVAAVGGALVGAVWARLGGEGAQGYGHFDVHTPEIAIAVEDAHRGHGIGGALMRAMLDHLKEAGYARVSLSVQKENRAIQLYRRLGFVVARETDAECVMVCELR